MLVVVDQVARRVVITPPNGTTISSLGGRIRLTAAAYDRLGQIVTDGSPHWESRQPNIASFDTSQGPSVVAKSLLLAGPMLSFDSKVRQVSRALQSFMIR